LKIKNGEFHQIEPYMFLNKNDSIKYVNKYKIMGTTYDEGNVAGLHIWADAYGNNLIELSNDSSSWSFKLSKSYFNNYKIIHIKEKKAFLIIGHGNPGFGPLHHSDESGLKIFKPPLPAASTPLPLNWRQEGKELKVILSKEPNGQLAVRLCSKNDGLLYLEIYIPGKPLEGKAKIEFNNQQLADVEIHNSVWISLKPYIDTISVLINSPTHSKHFTVPTTLVEIRKNKLFLNGEPFLIKGTLPGKNLTAADAEYLKSLGMNTLRGKNVLKFAERYDFMAIASIQGRGLKKCSYYNSSRGQKEFQENLTKYLNGERENGRTASESPYTLVIQLDNERAAIGGNPLYSKFGSIGADPWSDYVKGSKSVFKRLTYILVKDWNLVKPMAPMLPLGYANESLGYIAPKFLNVYMHNTYLEKDRYGVPLKEYMIWQGCNNRPFINTEYGANRYTPQSYKGAANSPVLEKLQAWNYCKLWNIFMKDSTIGGTCYRLFDGSKNQTIQGIKNFGIMTYDNQPKLACWDIWHMWRDFEVTPLQGDTNLILIKYKRNYWARNCQLFITNGKQKDKIELKDFSPNSERVVKVPLGINSFHWRIDYTTHRGLKMLADGAYPKTLEEHDFLMKLKKRKTYSFLKELLDTKVLTAQDNAAPPTFAQMQQRNGIIIVALQKPNGITYVTAFARIKPEPYSYIKSNINIAFTGMLTQVNEWTGKPIGTPTIWQESRTGIEIKNVNVPIIPGPIGRRSNKPLNLPVFRITPFNVLTTKN